MTTPQSGVSSQSLIDVTELDKFHKVLECVESQGFDEGTFLKICKLLKQIRDDEQSDETRTVVIRPLTIDFKCDIEFEHQDKDIKYEILKLTYDDDRYRNWSESTIKYKYYVKKHLIGEFEHKFKHFKRNIFTKLRKADNITIQHYIDDIKELRDYYENYGEFKKKLSEIDENECDDDDDHEMCDHHSLSDIYALAMLINIYEN